MNGPGPIKVAISNAKARKEEKQRASEQGYKYNRNIIHDAGEGKSRMIKGSVAAAAKGKVDEAKQGLKKVSTSVKQGIEKKVDRMQDAKNARKAMQAGESRGRKASDSMGTAKEKKTNEIIQRSKKGFVTGGTKKMDTGGAKRKASANRAIRKQSARSMKNRAS
jgi:hypothetical protein